MTDQLAKHFARWSYEGVDFPATEHETEGGHDSATHSPYLGAQQVETTGPRAYKTTVQVPLHSGVAWPEELFPATYRRLVRAFEETPKGLLTHPTRGTFVAHVDSWKEVGKGDRRDGVSLTVQFTEDAGQSEVLDFAAGDQADPGEAALARAAEADAAAPSGVASTTTAVAAVTTALAYLEAADRTRLQATGTFDQLIADLGGRLVDAATAPATAHAYRYALERTRAAVFDYRARYLGDARPRTYVVPSSMSVAMIAAMPEVYGDARRGPDLLAANALRDPANVPAGTVIQVVD